MDLSHLPIDSWTLFGRIPVALAIAGLFDHARRHARSSQAAAAVAGFVAGFVVGTAALPSIIGALAGGVIGWAFALWAVGARIPWAYAVTRVFLMVVGVGRLGCLAAGCCFGRPSDLPWAIAYPAGSMAHLLHARLGWVGSADPALPVHPVALYEAVVLLACAAALPWLRKRARSDWSLALGVAAAYLALRAGIDPLRGMLNTRTSLDLLGPLSVSQWGFLLAALALAVTAWAWPRSQKQTPSDTVAVERRTLAVWLAAATATAIFQGALPPFMAALAFAALLLTALPIAREVAPERKRARAAVAVGLLLLVPTGLRASAGEDPGRFWVYGVEHTHGRLVRIGNQSTPPALLAQADAALDKAPTPEPEAAPDAGTPELALPEPPLEKVTDPLGPPEPRPEPLPRVGGEQVPLPAAPPGPPPADEWPRGRALVFYAGGGHIEQPQLGCGGPTHVYGHNDFIAGVGLEREAAVSDDLRQSWQVRLGIMGDRWTDTASDGYRASGLDLMGTASGMYHFDWKWAGIGLGGMVGVGSMRSPNPLFIPLGTSGFVMPGLYLRLGPYPFGFELGTGARDQFVPGAFFGWRGIIRRQEFRLGLETTESRRPFIIGMVYGDVRLRLTDGLALRLRLDVPLTGKTLEGTLAWAVSF